MIRIVLAYPNQAVTNYLQLDNHHTPFILPRFRGIVTENSRSNLETSHRKRGTPHKRPTAILLVNV